MASYCRTKKNWLGTGRYHPDKTVRQLDKKRKDNVFMASFLGRRKEKRLSIVRDNISSFEVTPKFCNQNSQSLLYLDFHGFYKWKSINLKKWGNFNDFNNMYDFARIKPRASKPEFRKSDDTIPHHFPSVPSMVPTNSAAVF